MQTEGRLRLADVFVMISDPRQPGKVEHDLVELLVVLNVSFCAHQSKAVKERECFTNVLIFFRL